MADKFETMRIAINRLSVKLSRETSQAACDLMEAELIALQRQLDTTTKV